MPTPARTGRGKRAPKLDFPVTAEMIATAVPQDSAHCMIADGVKAALPHARTVSVDLATIRFTDPASGRRYIYLTPPEAQMALLSFDHGVPPEPFHVAAHAAQIVETKATRRKEKAAVKATGPSLSDAQPEAVGPSLNSEAATASDGPSRSEEPRLTRTRATLVPNPAGGGTVPIKVGGNPPPIGPLASGSGTQNHGDPRFRLGRQRRFGLRVMGH